ncbi:alpha/beta hydrolase fold domain-containing protein [Luteolibacter algae]|uniref:Alpha/beta hydrolase fold domain-containing protein n=1 Tax=Luteolibacter algae TaxID=454151 RepID=A0ABW5D4M6_9BACT
MMFRPRLISALFTLTALLNSCSSHATGQAKYSVRKDVVYTPDQWPVELVADLYQPKTSGSTPAVLLIHGGGWNGSERRNDMVGVAKQLAKHGYFVMNATYRLTPDWKYPAPVEDLEQALSYLRSNAGSLGIDTSRIGTFGYSAGGHLAALIGLNPDNRIQAIVAGGAPTDLALWPNGKLTGLLIGGPLQGNEAAYRTASPVNHVTPDSPPIFIYHGSEDTLVPTAHPHALIAALEANNVEHQVYWINGRSHIMAHLFPAAAINESIDFLDSLLKNSR